MEDEQERYLVDAHGRKAAVVLSLARYRKLIEDLHDLAVIAERRDEPTIATEELMARLKRDGLL